MSKKKALVLGATGQDGSYICEFLLKKKYKVYGLARKSATGNLKNIIHLIENKKIFEKFFFLERGDLNDHASIRNLILKVNPDEVNTGKSAAGTESFTGNTIS